MPTAAVPRSPLEHSSLQEAAGSDWSVDLHSTAPSTNALAVSDPVARKVIVADHQTAGRGRLDRAWETPAGAALSFSAVVDPQVEPRWWPLLPLMAGLAVARAVGTEAALKWPNDVLIGDQKVCGILVERVESPAGTPLAVIGIGINVSQTAEELPVATATSLAMAGLERHRTELLGDVLGELRWGMGELMRDPQGLMASYRGRSATLDRDVRVHLPGDEVLEGRVFDIDDHGQLVVHRGGSVPSATARPGAPDPVDLVSVSAGDVVHVRPLR